jgi:hypothetical protein
MGTTIFPLMNGGPVDDDGPSFPAVTGRGSAYEENRRLLESGRRKKTPKQIIKEAEGTLSKSKTRMKKGSKPKNLRASGSKKKKVGPFGEAYTPVKATAKGNRVSEARGHL